MNATKKTSMPAQWRNTWRNGTAALCAGVLLALAACGGGGGGSSTTSSTSNPAPSPNAVPITVRSDANGVANVLQTSVQICVPGTSTCQTINNVVVDTGSTGVRIASAALSPQMLAAMPQESVNNAALSSCEQFLDGYTWGTMRTADVTIGPRSAHALPVQIFGDAAAGNAPADCSDNGTMTSENTPATFGSNGVIGISTFLHDCADCTTLPVAANYYNCATGNCQNVTVPLALQASNIVSTFAQDNNGVVIDLPSVAAGGQTTANGTLYFGVGTQPDNTMPGLVALETDPDTKQVSASYNGAVYPESYFDSGTNSVSLPDSSIAMCPASTAFATMYCPNTTLNQTATFLTASLSTVDEPFTIGNALLLSIGNPDFGALPGFTDNNSASGTDAIAFGLPFFFGHAVAVVNDNGNALGHAGPLVAIGPA